MDVDNKQQQKPRDLLVEYWEWAHSDLLVNVERGVVAEFIVAKAIGYKEKRVEWERLGFGNQTGM